MRYAKVFALTFAAAWAVACFALVALALGYSGKARSAELATVLDDAGQYRAEIALDTLAPMAGDFDVPDGATAYAAAATVVRVRDGARFPTTYLVLDTQCKRGSGVLAWLTPTGEVAGVGQWARSVDGWPSRVAAALCARVPGA